MGRRVYTPQRKARVVSDLAEVYDSATDGQRRSGRLWYPRALNVCKEIAELSDKPLTNVVYSLAALSPLTTWEHNVTMCKAMATRTKFRNPGTFLRDALRAWDCIRGKTEALSGPKVEAFARAILGDVGAIVIDRWMIRACGHSHTLTGKVTPLQYQDLAECITFAANLCGETPRNFQAILWVALRDGPEANVTPF